MPSEKFLELMKKKEKSNKVENKPAKTKLPAFMRVDKKPVEPIEFEEEISEPEIEKEINEEPINDPIESNAFSNKIRKAIEELEKVIKILEED